MKNDQTARSLWGTAYDEIPKSVFAAAAWHLANIACGSADEPGAAEERFLEEVAILHGGGHIPQKLTKKARTALEAAAGQAEGK